MTLSRKPWHTNHKNGGFSLIEILLVIVIIGVMMAVIIPRATRARVDAKYNVVRQMAAEVGKWSLTWANRNLETQRDDHTCDLRSYIETLTGDFTGDQAATSNWAGSIETLIGGGECRNPDTTAPIVTTVADIVPDVSITNPFNGISYFMAVNNGDSGSGGSHGPGKLYLASFQETSGADTYINYYFLYQGTDGTAWNDWFGNQSEGSLAGVRSGVFLARLLQ